VSWWAILLLALLGYLAIAGLAFIFILSACIAGAREDELMGRSESTHHLCGRRLPRPG